MPSPIRVGFIGLSATGGWANASHYPYLPQSPHYKITALCNSSVKSAQESIKAHGLDPSAKAYDSAESLAADPDVDLVVVCVKVDQHYRLAKPALLAGKDVFVEWPLGRNLQEADELCQLAKSKAGRHVVGLEESLAPSTKYIKRIIDEGKIGKVLSSSLWGVGMHSGWGPMDARAANTADVEFGGNLLTIGTMHTLETITSVLGELKSYTPLLANQRPRITVKNDDGTTSTRDKTSHDQVMLQGTFESGAVLSFHFRGGGPFKDTPGIIWRIYGEKGELSIEGDGYALSMGLPLTVKLHDFESEKVQTLDVPVLVEEWKDRKMPPMAHMMGLVYKAFYEEKGYVDFEGAVTRHKMIVDIYARAEK
ncbi:hypothetical protein ANO11243_093940 [Dothideomycetidae sp. 11243]|nr:hypothetical protein ANO11243_093940 [fungal sp. No.11243]